MAARFVERYAGAPWIAARCARAFTNDEREEAAAYARSAILRSSRHRYHAAISLPFLHAFFFISCRRLPANTFTFYAGAMRMFNDARDAAAAKQRARAFTTMMRARMLRCAAFAPSYDDAWYVQQITRASSRAGVAVRAFDDLPLLITLMNIALACVDGVRAPRAAAIDVRVHITR